MNPIEHPELIRLIHAERQSEFQRQAQIGRLRRELRRERRDRLRSRPRR